MGLLSRLKQNITDALRAKSRCLVNVEIVGRDAEGRIIGTRRVHNMLVTMGEAYIAGLLSGANATGGLMKYVGIGTGTTAEGTAQTALVTEVETRALATQSRVTTTHTNDTYQAVGAAITMGSARAVTECGLFDQLAVGGNMAARALFAVMNIPLGGTLAITWTIAVVGS